MWEGFDPKEFTTTMYDIKWSPINKDGVHDPCTYFVSDDHVNGINGAKMKSSTLSLSVLVVIEMLNALNALSEDGSLITMPPWVNPYLLLAIASSVGSHALICYWPVMAETFT